MNIPPIIKWTGSKRTQAANIVNLMPDKIGVYYEPFLGGGAVFAQLALSEKSVGQFVLSDLNDDLISLWNAILYNPEKLISSYTALWNQLGSKETNERKMGFYNTIRERFNQTRSPYDFMFLNRTSVNGLVRYNKSGKFNAPFHYNRRGITPSNLRKVISFWHRVLKDRNVSFTQCSYETIVPTKSDFMYVDPPYFATKGIYYGGIDYQPFFDFLKESECKWILSFDGKTTSKNLTVNIPQIYKRHLFFKSGYGSFKRLTGETDEVWESVYLNYIEDEK